LKKPVRLYTSPEVYHPTDDFECCAIYFPPDCTGKKSHKIVISLTHSETLETYLGCVAHEYIHAWQEERGYSLAHGEKSQFKAWARYLKKYYHIIV
jgi:hypothetical protein